MTEAEERLLYPRILRDGDKVSDLTWMIARFRQGGAWPETSHGITKVYRITKIDAEGIWGVYESEHPYRV